jgi:hypothetical protein
MNPERCPLWVKSGHLVLLEKESAFALKADILRGDRNSPLSAISRHYADASAAHGRFSCGKSSAVHEPFSSSS